MNHNQSSRPFLRLFSALQSTQQPADTADMTENTPSMCTQTAPAGGNGESGCCEATTCDKHHDSTRQGKPLQPEDNMIAGSVGPRSNAKSAVKPRRVEVSLADIAPVLADAINHQRGWLSDFSDDTVTIDADLYEVLLAYQQMRRLNAA